MPASMLSPLPRSSLRTGASITSTSCTSLRWKGPILSPLTRGIYVISLIHFPISLAYVDPAHRYPPEWFGDDKKVHVGEYE